jgi:hypothetical protein
MTKDIKDKKLFDIPEVKQAYEEARKQFKDSGLIGSDIFD